MAELWTICNFFNLCFDVVFYSQKLIWMKRTMCQRDFCSKYPRDFPLDSLHNPRCYQINPFHKLWDLMQMWGMSVEKIPRRYFSQNGHFSFCWIGAVQVSLRVNLSSLGSSEGFFCLDFSPPPNNKKNLIPGCWLSRLGVILWCLNFEVFGNLAEASPKSTFEVRCQRQRKKKTKIIRLW